MKRSITTILSIFFVGVALVSCEETMELDLRQTPSRIVIEAQVTNKPNYQSVKISRSTGFYTSGQTPRVTDAVVTVTDDTGEEYVFVHNPRSHADSVGIYVPQNDFVGTIGRTYTLHVTADGELYEATDKLFPVTAIDSLQFRVNEDQQEEAEEPGKIYELLVFAKEPQDEENYYLFRYYRNDTQVLFNPTDIYYSDDELLGENIDGIPSPVFYGSSDKARLEVYSLTRRGYIYYSDLYIILNNDGGGMFGSIPAPPRTNISNDALGFFQVSAVNEKETLIQ